MPRGIHSKALWFVLVSGLWSFSAPAQTLFQGRLTGRVTDPSGAAMSAVRVTAQNQNTGFNRSSTTQADGSYVITLLPPGRYVLVAEKAGFEKEALGPIHLAVNQRQRVDVRMAIGQMTTSLTVEAKAPVLDAETSSVGTTLGAEDVQEIPINGRDFLALTLLVPGVTQGVPGSRIAARGGAINVNGLQDSMNSYWLDGLDDTSPGLGQFTVSPPLDAIREFRMETGVYDARFGTHAGAQVNIVTRSGTNEIHGEAYDYLQNASFDARNYFEPSVPPFSQNQFGLALGGPVVLPGIYDGHDRTFFYIAYEGLDESRSFFNRARVPTLAERDGDFTDLLAPGCPVTNVLINPVSVLSGQPQPFTNIRQVLPGGPDPIGQALVSLTPAPNIANASCGSPNYTAQVDRSILTNSSMLRLDHHWGSKDSMFFNYNLEFDNEFLPSGPDVGTGTGIPGFGTYVANTYQMGGVNWTHSFGPALLNELKLTYNRYQLHETNQDRGNMTATELGIEGLNISNPSQTGLPNLNFGGYAGLGSDPGIPERGAVNTFELGDTLTQVIGNHTLAYGGVATNVRRGNFTTDSTIRGDFDFTGLTSGGLGLIPSQAAAAFGCSPPGCVLGNSVADALLGLPTDWINGFQQYISATFGSYDAFIQDTWKAHRNLTLNLGLRYDYNGLPIDQGNGFSNFDFKTGQIMVAGTNAVTLESFNPDTGQWFPAGSTTLGSKASNQSLQYRDTSGFGPRLGFAWQPSDDSHWVFRGGYGIYYNQTFGDVYFQKVANPPFVRITAGNIGGALPAIASGQIPLGSGALLSQALVGIAAPVYPIISPFQINFRNAMIQEWSFDVQRELGSHWLMDLGYVGTRGLFLPQLADPNQPVPDPATQSANRPYPVLSGFSYTESSGASLYNALQFKVEHRYASGLSLLASYVYSKSMDFSSGPFPTLSDTNFPQNSRDISAEYALSDFNVPQRFALGYVYDLPFGTKLWRSGSDKANYLIKDWELAGTTTVQSGMPFTPQISGDISGADEESVTGTGNPTDRPNLTGQPLYPVHQNPSLWVSPLAFGPPAPFTFGNAGRNILTGPGFDSWDMALVRRFRLGESRSLEFRAEMFNLFNDPAFQAPQRDIASPSFGQIFNTLEPIDGLASGSPGDPREMQFALKLIW